MKTGALVPTCMVTGHAGVIKFTILEDDIPPLLPIGFLRQLGAQIDLTNIVRWAALDGASSPLVSLSSGHVAVDLLQGGAFPQDFKVPGLSDAFGISEEASRLGSEYKCSVSRPVGLGSGKRRPLESLGGNSSRAPRDKRDRLQSLLTVNRPCSRTEDSQRREWAVTS